MTRLQCELCGSIDIIKTEENVFQCQHCGCKYTLEQAKTLIFGGEVKTKATDFEITGGVLKKYNGEEIDVVVPDNVLRIGECAFEHLSIRSIKLSERLREIDRRAFRGCHQLTSIQLPAGLESIGEDAFVDCTALTAIKLPDKMQFGPLSFAGCASLSSIYFPEGVTGICCKSCTSLQSVFLPESVKEIQGEAFAGCASLESICLPKKLERIYSGAFSGCVSLANVYIPEGTKAVDSDGIEMMWPSVFSESKWRTFSFPAVRSVEWMKQKRCQHCGGAFVKKSLFKQVCTECGRERDY